MSRILPNSGDTNAAWRAAKNQRRVQNASRRPAATGINCHMGRSLNQLLACVGDVLKQLCSVCYKWRQISQIPERHQVQKRLGSDEQVMWVVRNEPALEH